MADPKSPQNAEGITEGFLGNLTPAMQTTLAQFKTELQGKIDHPRYDDQFLLRFLRARKFDLKKSKEMLENYLKWRQDFGVDNVCQLGLDFIKLPEVKKRYPCGYHGIDRKGRPIYIERPGAVNVSELLKHTDLDTLLKYWVQEYERLVEVRLPACSALAGKRVEQSLTILDMSGLGMSHMGGQTRDIMGKLSKICQDNYPELLGTMLIVNAPMVFSMIWPIAKPFLDEKTQKKIIVMGSSYKEKLFELADPSQLPEFLGGTCKYADADGWMFAEESLAPMREFSALAEVRKQRPFAPIELFPKEFQKTLPAQGN